MSSIEARVAALEYVVSITLWQLYSASNMSLEGAETLRRQVQERMSERPLTKLSDPAQSDVRSAEIVEAIDRLLGAAIALLREAPSRR